MKRTRREILKTATAAGIGSAAIGGLGVASANPCHKDFECEEGTYVKYELVEQDDGTCAFEEETETGIFDGTLEITETKDGDTCEPLAVEWEDPEYDVTTVMAFGGDDCETVSDPSSAYDAADTKTGLENPGGNTAAISNLQFCVEEVVYAQIDFAKGDVIEDLCEYQPGSDKISSISWSSEVGQIDGLQGQFNGDFELTEETVTVNYDDDYGEKLHLGVYLVPDPVFKDNGHIDFGATRCRQVLVDYDVDEDGDLGSLTADLPSP